MNAMYSFFFVAMVCVLLSAYLFADTFLVTWQRIQRNQELKKRIIGRVEKSEQEKYPPSITFLLKLFAFLRDPRCTRFYSFLSKSSQQKFFHEKDDAIILARATLEEKLSPMDLALLRSACMCVGFFAGLLLCLLLKISFAFCLTMSLISACMARTLPSRFLHQFIKIRMAECTRQLPEMIEMIALGSVAGISFDGALTLYCEKFSGTLPKEMHRALSSWQTGASSRESALHSLAERVGADSIAKFVTTSMQALRLGAPLSQTLMVQSEEARRAYRMQVEEAIAKAPIKMLLPMGTLILPAMLLLVLGPVLLSMSSGNVI